MGKVYPEIDCRLRDFIVAQPLSSWPPPRPVPRGTSTCRPKGMRGTFVILGPHRVAYLDYHGSGAETIAHLRDNGRITLMFCAFDGPPKIVRLHGRGSSVAVTEDAFADRLAEFPAPPDVHAVRAVITVEVERVSDSCGYAVPMMDFRAERDLLLTSHSRRSADDLVAYRATKNAASIDGLPVF